VASYRKSCVARKTPRPARGLTHRWIGLRPADLLVCFAPAARRAEAAQL
jgi:hypothetical protein